MRNLQIFNRALLAKQAWRVITHPNSLMAKTLMNKYFPNIPFMEVKVSWMASYMWRSILSARDYLGNGAIKVIGPGRSIDIWHDPWVPCLPNFKVLAQPNNIEESPQCAADLIEVSWNRNLLNSLFTRWEAEKIGTIPIPLYPEDDSWSWVISKSGEFTVHSAYYAMLKGRMDESSSLNKYAHYMEQTVECKGCPKDQDVWVESSTW